MGLSFLLDRLALEDQRFPEVRLAPIHPVQSDPEVLATPANQWGLENQLTLRVQLVPAKAMSKD